MSTSMKIQTENSTQPSSNVCGNQIHMFGLDPSHKKCFITPKDKYQYQ